jgi:hypothetical protein
MIYDANQNLTELLYDEHDRLEKMYFPANRLTSITHATAGSLTGFTSDAKGFPDVWRGGATTKFDFDNISRNGNLTINGETKNIYDYENRLVSTNKVTQRYVHGKSSPTIALTKTVEYTVKDGSKTVNVDSDYGGSPKRWGNAIVAISGSSAKGYKDVEGKPLRYIPADKLVHVLVGRAIPYTVGSE